MTDAPNLNYDYDIIVIGGGSAGLSVTSGAAQLGLRVALVEAGEMGGDCLNAGCVPSKALLSVAKALHHTKVSAATLGIEVSGSVSLDYAKAMAHVRKAIDAIAPHDSQERFESLGATVFRQRGKITGPHSVQLDDQATINATILVVATGASPFVPPFEGLDTVPYDTNETLFHRTTRPEKLVVVGGGPIGCEMAQAHARLGCEVTVIELGTIMPHDDPDAVAVVRDSLLADGITLLEHHGLERLEKTATGFIAHCKPSGPTNASDREGASGDTNASTSTVAVTGTDLLMAVGRKPNIDGLGLDQVGVETNRQGIVVDKRMRTNVKSIYALGDVSGGAQFTHMAGAHASAFVRGALFRAGVDMTKTKVPWVTYCEPELAQFGLTEAKARAAGTLDQVYRVELSALDRQVAEGDDTGFAKIMVDKSNALLGVTMVGKGAGDLITPWLVADAGGVKLSAIASMVVPYPTRGEVTKRLAGMAFVDRLFAASTKRLVRFLFGLPRF